MGNCEYGSNLDRDACECIQWLSWSRTVELNVRLIWHLTRLLVSVTAHVSVFVKPPIGIGTVKLALARQLSVSWITQDVSLLMLLSANATATYHATTLGSQS